MLTFDQIEIVTYILLVVCALYYQAKNSILPLILSFLFYSSGVSRFDAVAVKRTSGYVRVAGWDIFDMNDELALVCLNLFCLGTVLLIGFFMIYSNIYSKKDNTQYDTNKLFRKFIDKNKVFILILSLSYFAIAAGRSLLFAISFSYGFYAPFGAIGVIICLFFMIQTFDKIGYIFIATLLILYSLFIANLVLTSYVRFSLLGWIIPIGLALISRIKPGLRLIVLAVGGSVALVGFSVLGELRNAKEKTITELIESSVERIAQAEDSNMLDGFMMAYQSVPARLDHQYGLNHIEIFLRPIPRSIWPDKPSGGYVNKLNLNKGASDLDFIGISESMFGTFYIEGGIIGICIFCWLYGMYLAKVVHKLQKYHGMLGATLLGCIYASIVAWFRGGDFAGIFALLFLSYWPVLVFMRRYNAFLRREKLIERYNEQQAFAQKEGMVVNNVVVPMHPLLKSFS
ncbi:MAG: hypothetical protein ACOVMN_08230 [Flexibacteraceae bacterium]